jgi:hypothetical protein
MPPVLPNPNMVGFPVLENMRRLHPRGTENRGICVDTEGAMLGSDCVLVRRTSRGYRAIDREDASALQKCVFGAARDQDWLFRQCQRIADALDKGDLALAQIYGLHIPIDELDARQPARISLIKAGFDPDEPRIPEGDPHGGEWTTGSSDDEEQFGSPTDVAYPGTYHNWVVAQVAEHWRAKGAKVLTSVDLVARNGATARADIIAIHGPGESPVIVEVKTGYDPQYTPGQQVVYPMAQIGDHVYSPNSKIGQLGFSPGQWLPPMVFVTIYKRDAQSPYRFTVHPDPVVP